VDPGAGKEARHVPVLERPLLSGYIRSWLHEAVRLPCIARLGIPSSRSGSIANGAYCRITASATRTPASVTAVVNVGPIGNAGRGWESRIARSLRIQFTQASGGVAAPARDAARRRSGFRCRLRAPRATPPATSARAVRIQARRVRSFASGIGRRARRRCCRPCVEPCHQVFTPKRWNRCCRPGGPRTAILVDPPRPQRWGRSRCATP